ncbi:MAG: hypothetical protein ACRC6V_09330 [Bacteroidales bacterium]
MAITYINKFILDMSGDWTFDLTMDFLKDRGLTLVESQVIDPRQFKRHATRGDKYIVLHTREDSRDHSIVNFGYVSRSELGWYTSRDWVEIFPSKIDLPY